MFGLAVALAALAQVPEYVPGYAPQMGETAVLARDEVGRRVPVVKTAGAAMSFSPYAHEGVDNHYEKLVDGDQLAEIEAGTPVQIIDEGIKFRPPIYQIQILAGPAKGKTTYTYADFLRVPNPAFARAAAAARKKRGPLDKAAVTAEIKEALDKAKPDEAVLDLKGKKKLVRDAIDPICRKYRADFREALSIANQAGVLVKLNAERYDIAGNLLRK